MDKKVLGTKITKNPDVENQIVLWYQQEPDITYYEISKRLKDKYSVKISQPTIKKWKINFYKDKEKQFAKTKESVVEESKKEIDIKYEHLKKLLEQLSAIDERQKIIKSKLDSQNKPGQERIVIDNWVENIYKDYISLSVNIEDKILKYTLGTNPYVIARETLERIATYSLVLFKQYNVSEEDLNNFKEFIKDLDNEFYAKYAIERNKK